MDTSKKVFVTGGTGFIGSILIEKLLKRGFSVRALTRRPLTSANPNLEYVPGDIHDLPSIEQGIAGCRYAFHLAAYAKNWAQDRNTFVKFNITGTRHVFTAARKAGIEKIVWTSTIVTLGPTPKGVVGNEDMPRQTQQYLTEYERTKTQMENGAQDWIADGLPLVITNPTRVFGPGVMSESNSVTRLIDGYRRGRFPFLLNWGRNIGNYGFVDDVADGLILAMEKGTIGDRYILGGENVSLKQLFDKIAEIDGKKHFQIKMFYLTPLLVAKFFEVQAKLTGFYPPVTPGWVRTFIVDWAFSCDKAKRELGYNPISFEKALTKTCNWLDSLKTNKKSEEK
ncbi:NAD-dependent dehydratase [Planctomycetales bacterium]|nr:NAD-dependent dehydratase [Planctomycetales bacterium]